MMKRANCVVSTTCVKNVRAMAVAVLAQVLVDRSRLAASSQEQVANPSVARWVQMPRIRVLARRAAMHGPPSVKSDQIALVHAMIILEIVLKVHAPHVPPVIAHKVIVRRSKIVVRVHKVTGHKVSVLPTRIEVHVPRVVLHKANVHPIKTVAHGHRARLTAIRPSSVAGMYPMVWIPAHG